jgi:hypothetical protein
MCKHHLLLLLLHRLELAPAQWDALAPSGNINTSSKQHVLQLNTIERQRAQDNS